MNKNLFAKLGLFAMALPLVGAPLMGQNKQAIASVNADEHVEEAYDSIWITDLTNYVGTAPINSQTLNIDSIGAGYRAGYASTVKNVELKARVNVSAFTGNGFFQFNLRTKITDQWCSIDNSGYGFRLYANGMYEYGINGTFSGAAWGPHPALAAGTNYDLSFSTINCTDGSVHVKFVFDGSTFFDFYDANTPITDGGNIMINHEGATLSISGNGEYTPILNLNDVCAPITNANFPSTVDATTGKITTSATGADTYSGAVFAWQTSTDEYGYRIKVKPSAADGRLCFQIAGVNGLHDYNRPYLMGEWAWADTGYVYYWTNNGQRHFGHNHTSDLYPSMDYQWLAAYAADTEYVVEMSIKVLNMGTVVRLKIDGVYNLNFLDTNANRVKLNKSGSQGGITTTCAVYSCSLAAEFTSNEATPYSQKRIMSADLGTPSTINDSKFSRYGEPIQSKDGYSAFYNNVAIKDFSVKFKAKLNASGLGAIVFWFNYEGPSFGVWTAQGYQIVIYNNGMCALVKSGTSLFEGWCTTGFSIANDTEYDMEVAAYKAGDSEHVFFKLNGTYLINFVDVANPLNSGSWFAIQNSGIAGSYYAEDADVVNQFCIDYLKSKAIPTTDHSNTGACLTYYGDSKSAYADLSATQKNLFVTDSKYADMNDRMVAWAKANGETLSFNADGSTSIQTSSYVNSINNTINGETSSTTLIAVAAVVSTVAFCVLLVLRKKSKHN